MQRFECKVLPVEFSLVAGAWKSLVHLDIAIAENTPISRVTGMLQQLLLLQTVTMVYCERRSPVSPGELAGIKPVTLAHLVKLHTHFVDDQTFVSLHMPKLRKLTVDYYETFIGQFQLVLQACPVLSELSLTGCHLDIDPSFPVNVCLQSLSLSNCIIASSALLSLLDRCTLLSSLSLHFEDLNDYSAMLLPELARRSFPSLSMLEIGQFAERRLETNSLLRMLLKCPKLSRIAVQHELFDDDIAHLVLKFRDLAPRRNLQLIFTDFLVPPSWE